MISLRLFCSILLPLNKKTASFDSPCSIFLFYTSTIEDKEKIYEAIFVISGFLSRELRLYQPIYAGNTSEHDGQDHASIPLSSRFWVTAPERFFLPRRCKKFYEL